MRFFSGEKSYLPYVDVRTRLLNDAGESENHNFRRISRVEGVEFGTMPVEFKVTGIPHPEDKNVIDFPTISDDDESVWKNGTAFNELQLSAKCSSFLLTSLIHIENSAIVTRMVIKIITTMF
jgi:hypothetical protein